MGADIWKAEVPGQDDPQLALQELQARTLQEFTRRHKINLATMAQKSLSEMREAVENDRAEGDPYGLLESHEEAIKELEALSSEPMPSDVPGQIDLFRRIWSATVGGEPLCNVLDTLGTTHEWRPYEFLCHILSDEETQQYLGVPKPTLAQSRKAGGDLMDRLERGDTVCWRYYDQSAKPLGWYFMGAQFD
jgi:hypothetical protein